MSERKKTRLFMTGSAIFMGMLALAGLFFPKKILTFYDIPVQGISVLSIEITGAFYLGFAFLNWLARGNLFGGISNGIFGAAAAANAFFAAGFCYVLFYSGKSVTE